MVVIMLEQMMMAMVTAIVVGTEVKGKTVFCDQVSSKKEQAGECESKQGKKIVCKISGCLDLVEHVDVANGRKVVGPAPNVSRMMLMAGACGYLPIVPQRHRNNQQQVSGLLQTLEEDR